jgi:hypothetical protein
MGWHFSKPAGRASVLRPSGTCSRSPTTASSWLWSKHERLQGGRLATGVQGLTYTNLNRHLTEGQAELRGLREAA